ncbi:MAG: hypothetical protein AAF984_10740 [Verrucomicrobiota bacterium]
MMYKATRSLSLLFFIPLFSLAADVKVSLLKEFDPGVTSLSTEIYTLRSESSRRFFVHEKVNEENSYIYDLYELLNGEKKLWGSLPTDVDYSDHRWYANQTHFFNAGYDDSETELYKYLTKAFFLNELGKLEYNLISIPFDPNNSLLSNLGGTDQHSYVVENVLCQHECNDFFNNKYSTLYRLDREGIVLSVDLCEEHEDSVCDIIDLSKKGAFALKDNKVYFLHHDQEESIENTLEIFVTKPANPKYYYAGNTLYFSVDKSDPRIYSWDLSNNELTVASDSVVLRSFEHDRLITISEKPAGYELVLLDKEGNSQNILLPEEFRDLYISMDSDYFDIAGSNQEIVYLINNQEGNRRLWALDLNDLSISLLSKFNGKQLNAGDQHYHWYEDAFVKSIDVGKYTYFYVLGSGSFNELWVTNGSDELTNQVLINNDIPARVKGYAVSAGGETDSIAPIFAFEKAYVSSISGPNSGVIELESNGTARLIGEAGHVNTSIRFADESFLYARSYSEEFGQEIYSYSFSKAETIALTDDLSTGFEANSGAEGLFVEPISAGYAALNLSETIGYGSITDGESLLDVPFNSSVRGAITTVPSGDIYFLDSKSSLYKTDPGLSSFYILSDYFNAETHLGEEQLSFSTVGNEVFIIKEELIYNPSLCEYSCLDKSGLFKVDDNNIYQLEEYNGASIRIKRASLIDEAFVSIFPLNGNDYTFDFSRINIDSLDVENISDSRIDGSKKFKMFDGKDYILVEQDKLYQLFRDNDLELKFDAAIETEMPMVELASGYIKYDSHFRNGERRIFLIDLINETHELINYNDELRHYIDIRMYNASNGLLSDIVVAKGVSQDQSNMSRSADLLLLGKNDFKKISLQYSLDTLWNVYQIDKDTLFVYARLNKSEGQNGKLWVSLLLNSSADVLYEHYHNAAEDLSGMLVPELFGGGVLYFAEEDDKQSLIWLDKYGSAKLLISDIDEFMLQQDLTSPDWKAPLEKGYIITAHSAQIGRELYTLDTFCVPEITTADYQFLADDSGILHVELEVGSSISIPLGINSLKDIHAEHIELDLDTGLSGEVIQNAESWYINLTNNSLSDQTAFVNMEVAGACKEGRLTLEVEGKSSSTNESESENQMQEASPSSGGAITPFQFVALLLVLLGTLVTSYEKKTALKSVESYRDKLRLSHQR